MFNNQTRTRVPSPATLRALYQLAYISTGTAVGVATLCAEERRRRIVILQRIADNAKRIRQSPRYVHTTSRARSREATTVDDEHTASRMVKDEREAGDASQATVKIPSKNAGLPSVVDNGYDQISARDNHRTPSADLPFEEDLGGEFGNTSELNKALPGSQIDVDLQDDLIFPQYRRARPDAQLKPIGDRGLDKSAFRLRSDKNRGNFRTMAASKDAVPASAGDVKHDVGLFMRRAPWSHGMTQELLVADHLLHLALRCGSLSDARVMYEWKLRYGGYKLQDVRQICVACSQLATLEAKEDVVDFYAGLLATEAFLSEPDQVRLQISFDLAAQMLTWKSPCPTAEVIEVLLRPIMIGSAQRTGELDPGDLHVTLEKTVRGLLAENCIDAAANLIVGVSKCDHELALPLSDMAFDAASAADDTVTCRKILQWKSDHLQMQSTSLSQFEWFIQTCDRQKTYQMLNTIIEALTRPTWCKWLVTGISPQARLILATACTVQKVFPLRTFQNLYLEIPQDLKAPLKKAHSVLQLQKVWNSTRNLQAVRHVFKQLCNGTPDSRPHNHAMLVEMIDILISAQRPDQALELIRETSSRDPQQSRLTCLAALAMARKRDWPQVTEYLHRVSKAKDYLIDRRTSKTLNYIAHLFCRQHDPKTSWEFIKFLMSDCDLRLRRATVQSYLQCCITHKSLRSIRECLVHLRDSGSRFRVNTETVATLLNFYRWSQRPTHILMMHLCRDVVNMAPWLDQNEFVGVIRESLAADLRNVFGRNKERLQSWSKETLARLEQVHKLGLPLPPLSYFKSHLSRKTEKIVADDTAEIPPPNTGIPQITTTAVETDVLTNAAQDVSTAYDVDENNEPSQPDESRRRRIKVEQEMILAFSIEDDDKVLERYRQTLNADGLPLSPVTLEVATLSTLRLHGDDESHALALLDDARAAGMNVSCAVGPILMHRMHQLDAAGAVPDADHLRNTVIDYYRTNEENGWQVRHYVGVTAAALLIRRQRPEFGINILNAMFYSKWAVDRPLNMVAMTAYVQGFGALRSVRGIAWVVDQIFRSNIRVDPSFTHVLRRTKLEFEAPGEGDPQSVRRIEDLHRECLKLRRSQQQSARDFGINLIRGLAEWSSPEFYAGAKAVEHPWDSGEASRGRFGVDIDEVALPA